MGNIFYNQTLDYMSHEGIGEEIEKYAGMLKSDDNKQKRQTLTATWRS